MIWLWLIPIALSVAVIVSIGALYAAAVVLDSDDWDDRGRK